MATRKGPAEKSVEMFVTEIESGEIEFCVLGTTPLIMNRMSQKAWMELLAPKGRKTAADRASTLKHDPIKEFRDAPYVLKDEGPTHLGVMSSAFKRAMATAALDTPGAVKSKIEKLVYVPGEFTSVYGIPKVFMAITRSSDMNRTPDVRTRAILTEWACTINVQFVKPNLREQSIANLLVAAGRLCGIGDWRQEKGSGNYGSFTLVDRNNPDFKRIMKTQGRAAQVAALTTPEAYNEETAEMLAWFDTDVRKRGMKVAGDGDTALALTTDETAPPARKRVARNAGNGRVAS